MTDAITVARAAIDAAHANDPHRSADGRPAELVYGERVESWLERVVDDPSPALRLAARCQHLERWTVPRTTYPMDRAGYMRWRTGLYQPQAERARELILGAGVDAAIAERVAFLVAKKDLKSDPESQALEDAVCLVFLEHEIQGFATSHAEYPEAKFMDIIAKTWRKMSERGRSLALGIPLPDALAALVRAAIG